MPPIEGSVRGKRVRHVAARDLVAVDGTVVPLPDPDRLVHLQFRRFAGCPICNLHLRSFALRHDEVAAAVREIAVFHAPAAELAPHVEALPFAVVADPARDLYREFGVEASARSLLDPRAWSAIVRGIARDLGPVLARRQPPPSLRPTGGRLGLPADFLIRPDGEVAAAKWGVHANDQWSVDEVLALARRERGS